MKTEREPVIILYAEDDPEDFLMAKEALEEARFCNELHHVEDGQQLLDYLHHRRGYNPANAPRPRLILLDLNMPKKNGRDALREIKDDPDLRHIPLVILTTSRGEEEIYQGYALGASSFVTKPVTFEGLVEAMRLLGLYWFELVELPST